MSLLNKLIYTSDLLNNLDNTIINEANYSDLKNHLLMISDDLLKYKELQEKKTESENNEIKSKIEYILKRIRELEQNVRNKLLIANRYSSYLNSQ